MRRIAAEDNAHRSCRGQVFDIRCNAISHRSADFVRCIGGARFGHHIVGAIDDIHIVARTTNQSIRPGRTAGQHVITTAADNALAIAATRQTGIAQAGKDQLFDVRCNQGIGGQRNADLIRAAGIADAIGGAIDDIHVVTRATDHGVVAGSAIQRVIAVTTVKRIVATRAREIIVARAPGNRFVGRVACASEIRRSRRHPIRLNIGQALKATRKHIAGGHDAHFVSRASGIDNDVAGIIHDINIITVPADEAIDARSAIEKIVARTADQGVGPRIALQGIVAGIGLDPVVARTTQAGKVGRSGVFNAFDVGRQRCQIKRGDGGLHHDVDATVGSFVDHVIGIIDVEIVVATRTTDQGVIACATIQ